MLLILYQCTNNNILLSILSFHKEITTCKQYRETNSNIHRCQGLLFSYFFIQFVPIYKTLSPLQIIQSETGLSLWFFNFLYSNVIFLIRSPNSSQFLSVSLHKSLCYICNGWKCINLLDYYIRIVDRFAVKLSFYNIWDQFLTCCTGLLILRTNCVCFCSESY